MGSPALAGVGDLLQHLVVLPVGVLAKRLQLLGKAVAVAALLVGEDAGVEAGPLGVAAVRASHAANPPR